MKKIRLFLGLVLLAGSSFAGGVDSATGKYLYKGEVSGGYGTSQTLSEKESTYVSEIRLKLVKVKYRLSILMGEPVGNYTVYWEIDPTLYLRDGSEKNISAMSKPVQKAFKELKPIDPTQFIIGTSYQHKPNKHQGWMTRNIGFATDGGSLKRSGEGWSFNTPGSPDWSKFILDANSGVVMNSYLAEKDWYLSISKAKEAFGLLQPNAFDLKNIVNLTFGGISSLNTAIESEIRKKEEAVVSMSTTPPPSEVKESSVEVTGRIENFSSIEARQVQVQVGGKTVTGLANNDGTFAIDVPLEPGKNQVLVIYLTSDNERVEQSFQVVCEKPNGPQDGARWVADLGSGVKMDFMPIAAGSFQMGSNSGDDDEQPVHRVTLTKPFWISSTEVTQAQYRKIMGTNPSEFKGDSHPVEVVSWNDAVEFCEKLTKREQAAGRLKSGFKYTLPTEAQWEYACRAGTMGDYAGNMDLMAWCKPNSGGKTHPVGTKQANAWGLYDMHGNVWEWCSDWYGDYPPGGVTDPRGAGSGSVRVNRGGSWRNDASYCRSAIRCGDHPSGTYGNLGFRPIVLQR